MAGGVCAPRAVRSHRIKAQLTALDASIITTVIAGQPLTLRRPYYRQDRAQPTRIEVWAQSEAIPARTIRDILRRRIEAEFDLSALTVARTAEEIERAILERIAGAPAA